MLKWNNYYGEKSCYTELGMLQISCMCGREYKNGTFLYKIHVSIPEAETHEIITLTKIRGTLEDAKAKAEEMFANLKEIN